MDSCSKSLHAASAPTARYDPAPPSAVVRCIIELAAATPPSPTSGRRRSSATKPAVSCRRADLATVLGLPWTPPAASAGLHHLAAPGAADPSACQSLDPNAARIGDWHQVMTVTSDNTGQPWVDHGQVRRAELSGGSALPSPRRHTAAAQPDPDLTSTAAWAFRRALDITADIQRRCVDPVHYRDTSPRCCPDGNVWLAEPEVKGLTFTVGIGG